MTDILPDCMLPDGADPCAGYRQLDAKLDEARKRIAELEEQIEAYETWDFEPGTWSIVDLRKNRVVPHPIQAMTSPPERPLA